MTTSLSAVPLKLNNSVPEYLDLKSERTYNILHGVSEYSRAIKPATNPTISGVNIDCLPPSSNALIHPSVYKKAKNTLTLNIKNSIGSDIAAIFGSAEADGLVAYANRYFALRAYPFYLIGQKFSKEKINKK